VPALQMTRPLRRYLLCVAICAASLLTFWALNDLDLSSQASAYGPAGLLIGIMIIASVIMYGVVGAQAPEQPATDQSLLLDDGQLRQFVDAFPTFVWSTGPDGSVEFLNRKWLEYTGLSEQEAKGLDWTETIHPDDRNRLVTYWQSLRAGQPVEIEARVLRFDGTYRWFLFRGDPARDTSGSAIKWLGSAVDIDDLKRTEEALRNREQELQSLLDAIPTLIWCVTPEGQPDYINKKMSLYYFGDVQDVDRTEPETGTRLERALKRLMHPDDALAVLTKLEHSLHTGEAFVMRYRNRRSDGTYRWVDARAEPLRDDEGRIVKWYGVSVDIDDEIRTQERLRLVQQELSRASQLAGLAVLSASIAHEVNQPLAAVVTSSYACRRFLLADPPNLQRAKVTAERIVREANAATDVVVRVRALFKQEKATRNWLNINVAIGEVARLMAADMDANDILFTTTLDADLPLVFADRVQIQQVLFNLIRNGIDAMQSNAGQPKSLSVVSRRNGPQFVLIEVRDNGSGIADPQEIFEPMFTTKADGMGMGLSICRSIIAAHGGSLSVKNLETRGCVFAFILPIEEQDLSE